MQVSSVSASYYLQQMQQSMFQKADSNGDGSLSLDEFSAASPEKNAGSTSAADAAKTEKLFKSIDTDGDGSVSENEMSAFMSKLSSDTQASIISLQQQPSGGQDPMMALMSKADSNGDGTLSLDEFTAAKPDDVSSDQSNKMFSEMDANGDGKVTQDEMKTFAESHHHHHAGGVGHMPPPASSGDDESSSDTSLTDILSGNSSSSSSDTSSTTSLADVLNQTSGAGSPDDTSGDAGTDLSKQLEAYISQMLSNYGDQAKSATSSLSVSV